MEMWIGGATVVVAIAWLISFALGCQAWEHRRIARGRLALPASLASDARVAILAPCKGVDEEFELNLQALFAQSHPNFELWFAVEDEADPACAFIARQIDRHPEVKAGVVAAGMASHSCQKVHNLRAALQRVSPEVQVVAFVDSDARPHREWLLRLVARLDCPDVGAVTGYRWFVPQRDTLCNWVLYGINAGAASLYARKGLLPIWGGSWAMRREEFRQLGIAEAWSDKLTDDLVATNVLRAAGRRVVFEPACMLASPIDLGWSEMLAFVSRQYLIGKHYLPAWWGATLLATTLGAAAFWGAWGVAVLGFATGANGASVAAIAGLLLYGLGVVRGAIRRDLVQLYFSERTAQTISAARFDMWAWPLVSLVHWGAIARTTFARTCTWRGITYRLLPAGRTEVVAQSGCRLPPQPSRAA